MSDSLKRNHQTQDPKGSQMILKAALFHIGGLNHTREPEGSVKCSERI